MTLGSRLSFASFSFASFVCCYAAPVLATGSGSAEPHAHRASRLLVANSRGNDIVAFAQTDGRFLGVFVGADQGLEEPDRMAVGPDGALYVTSGSGLATAAVLRYDVDTTSELARTAYSSSSPLPRAPAKAS